MNNMLAAIIVLGVGFTAIAGICALDVWLRRESRERAELARLKDKYEGKL